MDIDNAVIVYHVMSPWIAKADLAVRCGKTAIFRTAMRDEQAAVDFLARTFPGIAVKVIVTD